MEVGHGQHVVVWGIVHADGPPNSARHARAVLDGGEEEGPLQAHHVHAWEELAPGPELALVEQVLEHTQQEQDDDDELQGQPRREVLTCAAGARIEVAAVVVVVGDE